MFLIVINIGTCTHSCAQPLAASTKLALRSRSIIIGCKVFSRVGGMNQTTSGRVDSRGPVGSREALAGL